MGSAQFSAIHDCGAMSTFVYPMDTTVSPSHALLALRLCRPSIPSRFASNLTADVKWTTHIHWSTPQVRVTATPVNSRRARRAQHLGQDHTSPHSPLLCIGELTRFRAFFNFHFALDSFARSVPVYNPGLGQGETTESDIACFPSFHSHTCRLKLPVTPVTNPSCVVGTTSTHHGLRPRLVSFKRLARSLSHRTHMHSPADARIIPRIFHIPTTPSRVLVSGTHPRFYFLYHSLQTHVRTIRLAIYTL